jgi:hypothetical protein
VIASHKESMGNSLIPNVIFSLYILTRSVVCSKHQTRPLRSEKELPILSWFFVLGWVGLLEF